MTITAATKTAVSSGASLGASYVPTRREQLQAQFESVAAEFRKNNETIRTAPGGAYVGLFNQLQRPLLQKMNGLQRELRAEMPKEEHVAAAQKQLRLVRATIDDATTAVPGANMQRLFAEAGELTTELRELGVQVDGATFAAPAAPRQAPAIHAPPPPANLRTSLEAAAATRDVQKVRTTANNAATELMLTGKFNAIGATVEVVKLLSSMIDGRWDDLLVQVRDEMLTQAEEVSRRVTAFNVPRVLTSF